MIGFGRETVTASNLCLFKIVITAKLYLYSRYQMSSFKKISAPVVHRNSDKLFIFGLLLLLSVVTTLMMMDFDDLHDLTKIASENRFSFGARQKSSFHSSKTQHMISDFYNCQIDPLDLLVSSNLKNTMASKFQAPSWQIIDVSIFRFPNGGMSATLMLANGHVSMHAWPKSRFLAIDIFAQLPERVLPVLKEIFKPNQAVSSKMRRNVINNHQEISMNRNRPLIHLGSQKTAIQSATLNPCPVTSAKPSLLVPGPMDLCVNADPFKKTGQILQGVYLGGTQSPHALLEIFDKTRYGKCILLDRHIHHCEQTSDIVSRELSTAAMEPWFKFISHRNVPRLNIEIIGGADGNVASHLLNYYETIIDEIQVIDLDETLSKITNRYFPVMAKLDPFSDPRVHWKYTEALLFTAMPNTSPSNSKDIIIVDCTDHRAGAANIFYMPTFYFNVFRTLRPGGRLVQQMNVDHPYFKSFRARTERLMQRVGLRIIRKWRVSIPSRGERPVVFWVVEKPTQDANPK
jgi:S-adenosylmethionine decarboxylase